MHVVQRLFDIQNDNNKQNAKVTKVPLSTKFICRRVKRQKKGMFFKKTSTSVAQKHIHPNSNGPSKQKSALHPSTSILLLK
jgi:hypothetical protein